MNKTGTLILLVISITFAGCSSPKITYATNCHELPPKAVHDFLTRYDAKGDSATVLTFSGGYDHRMIKITNKNKVIFHDYMQSNKVTSLAKTLKINNNSDVVINDIQKKYSFTLKSKELKKYKYVYIFRKYVLKKNDQYEMQYEITYSNTLCGFK